MQRGTAPVESSPFLAAARKRFLRIRALHPSPKLLLVLLGIVGPGQLLGSRLDTVRLSAQQTSSPAPPSDGSAQGAGQRLRVEGVSPTVEVKSTSSVRWGGGVPADDFDRALTRLMTASDEGRVRPSLAAEEAGSGARSGTSATELILPGAERCRIDRGSQDNAAPDRSAYRYTCDSSYRTRDAGVAGYLQLVDLISKSTRGSVEPSVSYGDTLKEASIKPRRSGASTFTVHLKKNVRLEKNPNHFVVTVLFRSQPVAPADDNPLTVGRDPQISARSASSRPPLLAPPSAPQAGKADFINSGDQTTVIERAIADYLKLKGVNATWEESGSGSFVYISIRASEGKPAYFITVSAFHPGSLNELVLLNMSVFTNFKVQRNKVSSVLDEANLGGPQTCRWKIDNEDEVECVQFFPLPEAQYSLPINEVQQIMTLNIMGWNQLFQKILKAR